jgi:hypothetical protein
MPAQVLTNVKLLVDGRDMSGQMNAVGVEYGVDALDGTVYGVDTRVNASGLKTTTMSHQGYWASAEDEHIFDRVGARATVSILPSGSNEGDVVYFNEVVHSTYTLGGAVGELLPFSFDAEAAGSLVQGVVLKDPTQVTGNGNSTGEQIGAVAAGEKFYAALHITALTGGTLTVTIESDDNSGFTSPITQATFTAATVPGGELKVVSGAITDDYWRAVWTLTGGSATFIVSAGIL